MTLPYININYEYAKAKIQEEILPLDEQHLDGTAIEDWVRYFTDKYAVQPIVLLPEPPVLEKRIEHMKSRDPISDRPYMTERVLTLVGLRVEQNADLPQLLKMQASHWWYGSTPHWEYRNGCIFVEANGTDVQEVQRRISEAKQGIEWLNADIDIGNRSLPPHVELLIKRQMEAVGARTEAYQRLAEAIGAELMLTAGTERRLQQAPKVKEDISRLRRPQAQQKVMPRLDQEEFTTILSVVDAQGQTFERTPGSVAKLEEEDIRNMILGALNAAFALGAVGEAFSRRGKTDILLVVPEGGVFIAEAKIWGGPKTVQEALDQILGYLTWRDAYGVVLLFSRNKGFSSVLQAIPGAIVCKSLRGDVRQIAENHWSARHTFPGDGFRTVEIHYLAYDVHAEATPQ